MADINALWFGEFPEELIPHARKHCKFLVGDAQGFVRHVEQGGAMHHKDWANKSKYLKYFDLFKIDNKEAKTLCGATGSPARLSYK